MWQIKDAEAMVRRATSEFGHLDILVNNASISAGSLELPGPKAGLQFAVVH
jgi:NAD(P)-dependent dehydrogenase (short-subunit alcohol dehydrogenase family)